tara:strand:+ start:7613 stop:7774 length:162 start_codon:yes stop_codon:yes gene_type:complete
MIGFVNKQGRSGPAASFGPGRFDGYDALHDMLSNFDPPDRRMRGLLRDRWPHH